MPLSASQLADLEEIRSLRIDFGHAVDAREWSMMAGIFTPEVDADLSAFGAPAGRMTRDAFVGLFRHSFRHQSVRTVQTYTNARIRLDGDTAVCTSLLHGWRKGVGFEGGDLFELRARYEDRVRRTAEGWRIEGTRLDVIDVIGNMGLVS